MTGGSQTPEEVRDAIRKIDKGIQDLRLPFLHERYVKELFDARGHVDLVRLKIDQAHREHA